MAVPKKKKSKSRTMSRKAENSKVVLGNLVPCPKCGGMILPHKLCSYCGHYKGRKVVG